MKLQAKEIKKIVYLFGATHLGGAERSIVDTIIYINNNYHAEYFPIVILPKNDGPLLQLLDHNNVVSVVVEMPKGLLSLSKKNLKKSIFKIMINIPKICSYFYKLTKYLKSERAYAIHTNGIKQQIISAPISFFVGSHLIWHLRDVIQNSSLKKFIKILMHLTNPGLIANSNFTLNSTKNSDDFIRHKVIYNGFNFHKYNRKKEREFNKILGFNNSHIVVGILGTFSRWKGHEEFLEMANLIAKKDFPVIFAIVGGEIYDTDGEKGREEKLKSIVKKFNLEDKVVFTGFVHNPEDYLASIDILVHASIRPEPFGRVIVEAMAAGIPVVASGDGGVKEIIKSEYNGLLYPPSDVNNMSNCVIRLINEEGLAMKLAYNAKSEIIKKFSMETHAKLIKSYYDSISSW